LKKLLQLATFGCAALALTTVSTHAISAQVEPKRIEITAKRFFYDTPNITLKKGEPVTLVLHTVDAAHGLRIREFNVDIHAPAKGTAQATFTPDKTGDFVGHCSVFCGSRHGSMQLTLHVVE
jgi:cytochrome c oxidase subunit 2